jgi:hypothetical protein
VLDCQVGSRHFRRFLVTEFSAENLLFLEQSRALVREIDMRKETNESLTRHVGALVETFLLDDSLMAVNVSGATKKAMRGALMSGDLAAIRRELQAAHDGIFYLLKTDSFPRFQMSAFFRDMRDELRQGSQQANPDETYASPSANPLQTELVSISSSGASSSVKGDYTQVATIASTPTPPTSPSGQLQVSPDVPS